MPQSTTADGQIEVISMLKPGTQIIYFGPHKPWYGRSGVVDALKGQKVFVYLEEIPGRCYVDEADLQPKVVQG